MQLLMDCTNLKNEVDCLILSIFVLCTELRPYSTALVHIWGTPNHNLPSDHDRKEREKKLFVLSSLKRHTQCSIQGDFHPHVKTSDWLDNFPKKSGGFEDNSVSIWVSRFHCMECQRLCSGVPHVGFRRGSRVVCVSMLMFGFNTLLGFYYKPAHLTDLCE